MINLNVNRIEARLNRPGPNLITPVHYLVIGGGFRGSGVLSSPGGESGEFNTGILNFEHETTATFSVGRGALGVGSTTIGLAVTGSQSELDYPNDSTNIVSLPGSQSAADCNPGVPSATGPCNAKGTWIHDPTLYNAWAQDGGKSYDVPGTANDEFGTGGGLGSTFPWATNRGDDSVPPTNPARTPAYNGTGGGGGSGFGSPPGQSGDGGNGVVGLAIYDPNEIFDVTIVAPTRGQGDVTQQQTIVKWEGYRIWYFHGSYSVGSFTINGRKQ